MENKEKLEDCAHGDFHVFKDKENNGDVTYIGICFECGLTCELYDKHVQQEVK